MKKAVLLLACACALLAVAIPAMAAVAPTRADMTTTQADTNQTASSATAPKARTAGTRLRVRYRHWRQKLHHYGVWHGRNLVRAAASDDREPTARELRRSIRRMKTRFTHWSRTYEGRAKINRFKNRHIPRWGKQKLASIAWCESRNNPRAVGGGGAYRGMYQFSFSTWRVVGGWGDPAAAPRSEQTWRAWVLLSQHGSGHWPVCG